MADRQLLPYPDPPLSDDAVALRRWAESDVDCVEEATFDPRIPQGTTVPAAFTVEDGLAWIERQTNGDGDALGPSPFEPGEHTTDGRELLETAWFLGKYTHSLVLTGVPAYYWLRKRA